MREMLFAVWLIELALTMALPCLSSLRSMSVVSPLTAAASPSLLLHWSEYLRVLTDWLLFARQWSWQGDTFKAKSRLKVGRRRAAIGSRRVDAGETVLVKTDGTSLRHRLMTWNISARPHLIPTVNEFTQGLKTGSHYRPWLPIGLCVFFVEMWGQSPRQGRLPSAGHKEYWWRCLLTVSFK